MNNLTKLELLSKITCSKEIVKFILDDKTEIIGTLDDDSITLFKQQYEYISNHNTEYITFNVNVNELKKGLRYSKYDDSDYNIIKIRLFNIDYIYIDYGRILKLNKIYGSI
jgi:hypothetical protein